MGVCGDSGIIAKVAMIIVIVAFVCATISIFTPYWQKNDGDGYVSGLFSSCDSNLVGICFDFESVKTKFSNTTFWNEFLATLSLQMIGWVGLLAAMIVIIVYACCPNKILGMVCIFLLLIAEHGILCSGLLYGLSMDDLANTFVSWSFGLDLAAGALTLTAEILLIINGSLP